MPLPCASALRGGENLTISVRVCDNVLLLYLKSGHSKKFLNSKCHKLVTTRHSSTDFYRLLGVNLTSWDPCHDMLAVNFLTIL